MELLRRSLAATAFVLTTAHNQKIVEALSETMRPIAEIVRAIDRHGGSLGAFQSAAAA